MQFRINGPREGLGVMRNDTHAPETFRAGNVPVGDHVTFGRRSVAGSDLRAQILVIAPGQNDQSSLRSIMPPQRAWAFYEISLVFMPQTQLAGDRAERFLVNYSRPQHLWRRYRQVQHRRFDSHLRLAAVHDQRQLVAEALENMRCV